MTAPLTLDRPDRTIHGTVPMSKTAPPAELPWDELGLLLEGLSLSSRPLHVATRDITEQYSLGPRGAWILVLIDGGQVYPADITNVFCIGRSLISAELARLTEAGLIDSVRSPDDGRRTQLTLTALGADTCARVRDQLRLLVATRLKGYSRDDLAQCARILRDFRHQEP